MLQEIIALSIVFSAFAYTGYSGFKMLTSKKTSGCGTGCNCEAKKEIKSILLNKERNLKMKPLCVSKIEMQHLS